MHPVGNMLLDRDGIVWPVAAGACELLPARAARSPSPAVSARSIRATPTYGTSKPPTTVSVNRGPSNRSTPTSPRPTRSTPTSATSQKTCVTHAFGAGDGYTDRKIDPATATAVEGVWFPGSVTSSGTWSLEHIRIEARNRPPAHRRRTTGDDDMTPEQADQLAELHRRGRSPRRR